MVAGRKKKTGKGPGGVGAVLYLEKKPGPQGAEVGKKATRSPVRPKFRGRPKKYATAKALAKAATEYFDSISRVVTMCDPATQQPIRGDDGNPIETVQWLRPPTETALALHIGVDPRTWTNYRDDPELGPVVEWAKEICKAYLLEQLVTRTQGSTNGLIFALGNYGMKEQQSVEVSGLTLEEFVAGKEQSF